MPLDGTKAADLSGGRIPSTNQLTEATFGARRGIGVLEAGRVQDPDQGRVVEENPDQRLDHVLHMSEKVNCAHVWERKRSQRK